MPLGCWGWERAHVHGGRPGSRPDGVTSQVHGGRGLGQFKEVVNETFSGVWSPHVAKERVIRGQFALRFFLLPLLLSFGLLFWRWKALVASRWPIRWIGRITLVMVTRGFGTLLSLAAGLVIGVIALRVLFWRHGGGLWSWWSRSQVGHQLRLVTLLVR
jgi:hypothetical protein